MLKLFKFLPAALILFVLAASTGCSTGFTNQKPRNAPDFQLQTLDGQTVSLSQLRGRPVLLNFWASWCQPCRDEMPFLQQIYNEYKDKGLAFFAIDEGETPEAINTFFSDNALSLPVLLDTDKKVAHDYQLTGVPETFIIDKNGIIRKWQIGAYPDANSIADDLKLIMP